MVNKTTRRAATGLSFVFYLTYDKKVTCKARQSC